MKIFAVLCMLVAGAASYSYTINSVRSNYGYAQQEMPQLVRAIESKPTAFSYEGPESSYGQRHHLERPTIRSLRHEIPITRFNHMINPNSAEYNLEFESANGIKSQESGSLKNIPVTRVISEEGSYGYGETRQEESVEAVQTKSGQTSWCSPEGIQFTLTYTADETGYHPELTSTQGMCETAYSRDVYSQRQAPAYGQTRFITRNPY